MTIKSSTQLNVDLLRVSGKRNSRTRMANAPVGFLEDGVRVQETVERFISLNVLGGHRVGQLGLR